jgi:hypothetical protein
LYTGEAATGTNCYTNYARSGEYAKLPLNTLAGPTAVNSVEDTKDWAKTETGLAEVAKATKTALATAAAKEVAARTAWEAGAKAEAEAAKADLTRAQDLLKALVAEVVPLAQKEYLAKVEVDKATASLAKAVNAGADLGACADKDNKTVACFEYEAEDKAKGIAKNTVIKQGSFAASGTGARSILLAAAKARLAIDLQ